MTEEPDEVTVVLEKSLAILFMVSLSVCAGCAAPLTQQPTTVRPDCNISWDKTNDTKVTGYQLTVIDQSNRAIKEVRFIPVNTTKIACKDAGASHEGLWNVTIQACYDKSTCGSTSEAIPMHITAE